MAEKIRIAFIKFGGLSAGGTERWLQMMAANLPKDEFDIDFYYCDAAPYVNSDYKHPDTDPDRLKYMQEHNVNLIKFNVGAKDITKPTHDWIDTDFWEVFDSSKYDFVQTAKAGPAEYPYYLIDIPVVEYLTLNAGVDKSSNIAWSIHLSEWQRSRWFKKGGNAQKSSIIPIPAEPPASVENLRNELKIPEGAIVAGFHQRPENTIASEIPLEAFAKIQNENRHFIIMGGGSFYKEQAQKLNLKNVHFVPVSAKAEDISKFLNTLDIFAHGRKDGETFGTVFAEAMVHGKPCLSHYSPIANAQVETIGPAGLFANNLDDYTRKLEKLFSDETFRKKLASKAIAHAKEYYSLESCVKRLIKIYKQLTNKPFEKEKDEKISYGYSDMGFLYAGIIEEPANIAYHVLTGGIPEEFDTLIVRFFLPKVKTFFDIGANTGIYCLIAANECAEDAKVFAFEPQPDCFKYLQKTIYLNNWEEKLKPFQIGIGDKQDTLTFHLAGTGSTFDNSFNDNAELPTISVKVDTFDKQIQNLNIEKVDFIKIDVEGFEQKVLEGCEKTILKDKPIMFIEIADHIKGRNYRNPNYATTLNWIKKHGYKILRSTEDEKLVIADSNAGQSHIAMYLCIPDEKFKKYYKELKKYITKYKFAKQKESSKKVVRKIFRNLRWILKKIRILK